MGRNVHFRNLQEGALSDCPPDGQEKDSLKAAFSKTVGSTLRNEAECGLVRSDMQIKGKHCVIRYIVGNCSSGRFGVNFILAVLCNGSGRSVLLKGVVQ